MKLDSPLGSQRGSVAIVMVMGAIALMTAMVINIAYRAKVSTTIVTNRRDALKAYQLAKAAYRWSILRLQIDSKLDQIPAIPGTNYGGKKDDLTEVQWNMPITYPFPQGMLALSSEKNMAEDLGGSFISVISDESSRINLNDVGSGGMGNNRRWSGTSEILENLLLSPRFQLFRKGKDHRALLWALEDWIDSDSEVNHMAGGIEDAQYRVDVPNFNVKNAPLYTIDELRLLQPMSDAFLKELRPFVTVYPYNAKLPRSSGSQVVPLSKINVNTAPLELIAATFNRQVIQSAQDRLLCAQELVKYRQLFAYRSISGNEPTSFVNVMINRCKLRAGTGPNAPLSPATQQVLDVRSDTFRIEATGVVNNVTKVIHAVVHRGDPQKIKVLYWKVRT